MGILENINEGDKLFYSDQYFSGDYNHEMYIKRANDDGSNKPKYYIRTYTRKNGELEEQGYIYFYLDYEKKESKFIGIKVLPEYRDLNIGSFLVASWIDLCLNNGYDFLGVNEKQRKPFLLYLLKTYGFEILDKSLYETRPDVITICRNTNILDRSKLLLFRDPRHEKTFMGTNVYKTDNYRIIHSAEGIITLDNIILPLQSAKRNKVDYQLLDEEQAKAKTETVMSRHHK